MVKFLVEDEWEADDIISHCKDHGYEYKVLSQDEIRHLSVEEFLEYVPFCSTLVVQSKLKEKGLDHLIPDTYTAIFEDLYGRKITHITYKDLGSVSFPYFIKSAGNDKIIDGTVVTNKDELDDVWTNVSRINDVNPGPDMELYICDPISFMSEHRLLIGKSTIYGRGFQRGNSDIIPTLDIIENIIRLAKEKFYCVDVGYDGSKWIIVEVNPPFSLDDFGIELDKYIQYAVDFWMRVHQNYCVGTR